jgi:hypothetical protein
VILGIAVDRSEQNSSDKLAGLVVYDEDAVADESEETATVVVPVEFLASESIDWTSLSTINASANTWLQVTGCGISTCVMDTTEETSTWWLTHDAWGNLNSVGCPYFDWRCPQGSVVRYIYGHHLTNEKQGFSPLAQISSNEDLAALGYARLVQEDSVKTFRPAYGLVVEESYLYLRYVPTKANLSEWLSHIAADAKYFNPDVSVSDCSEVLVLVTCSNVLPGPKPRSAVVFVR